MRQSQFFAPTLRQAKADNAGHALLLRGAFVRQLTAGIYSYLPLGLRVLARIENIVRQEMNVAGGVELLLPALHPAALWAETGRDKIYGPNLFRLKDRKDSDYVLGPTHEEPIVDLIRGSISSHKQLPQRLYQIQTKFRDEERPRAGLLRGREFVMKDLYSFDADLEGLDKSFDAMVTAYSNIFARCGLDAKIVEAAGGGIGGFDTKEFMVASASGEDEMLWNAFDGYAANLELATSALESVENRTDISDELEEFATPGVTTIAQLENFDGGATAIHQIKTLVLFADEKPLLALLRGDHQLNESKLQSALGADVVRAANEAEIVELLGARPGSLGALRVLALPVYADEALRGRNRMTTGANRDALHVRGVDVARDLATAKFVDIRTAQAGESSPRGGGVLQSSRCIELGHVFKLGNKYTKAMGAKFLDENGKERIIEMGCYGIGVSRVLAAVAEANLDERGIIWPQAIAPFQVHLLLLERDEDATRAADALYEELRTSGFDVLYDDRNERPGSKFADADLFGIPFQIMLGKSWKENGEVEIRPRDTREFADKNAASTRVPLNEAVSHLREKLSA